MTITSRTAARLLAGGCALAITLGACSSSSDSSSDGGDPVTTASTADVAGSPGSSATTVVPGDDTGSSASTSTTEASDESSDDASDDGDTGATGYHTGPLDEFLGFGTGIEQSPEDQAKGDQQMRESEQLVATCMSEQGFEYVPIDPAGSEAEFADSPWSLPAGEFASQYGYGITTIDRDSSSGDVSPNEAIVDAMSVPEKQAYYHALVGDVLVVDENGDITKRGAVAGPMPITSDSCSAKASAQVYGPPDEQDDSGNDPYASISQAISALYDRVDNDPRVTDAVTAWSNCLADAGFPGFTGIYDPSGDVQTKATALMGEDLDPDGVDPAALEELRTYERALGTADHECQIPYNEVHDQVRAEIETAFIDEHRTELEQYRDALASGEAGKG